MTAEYILNTNIPVPPSSIAGSNFIKRITDPELSGMPMIERIKTHVNLAPDMHSLDVGCGIGRMTVAFSHLLSKNALAKYQYLPLLVFAPVQFFDVP